MPIIFLERPSGLVLLIFPDGSSHVATAEEAAEIQAQMDLCYMAAEMRAV